MSFVKNGFVIVTPVWGGYVDTFLNVCLPSLLIPGNLLDITVPCTYQIYTTAAGKNKITSHPLFITLKEIMPVYFQMIEGEIFDAYSTLTLCHQKAIHEADNKDSAVLIVMPDCVFARGSVKTVERLGLQGARLVSVPNLRLNLEDTSNILIDFYKKNDRIDMNARDLMKIALNNLHQLTQAGIWEQGPGVMLPSFLFWRVRDEGLIGRFFYGCYFMIYPRIKHVPLNATLDVDYIYQACPDQTEHYLCLDSDRALILELTSDQRACTGFPRASIEHLLYFSEFLNEYQLAHATHSFKLHCGIKDLALWKKIQKQSDKVIDLCVTKVNSMKTLQKC